MRDRKQYWHNYYLAHKEEVKARSHKNYQIHKAKGLTKIWSKRYRESHKQQESIYKKTRRASMKLNVMSHYSANGMPNCLECGINDIDVLTIDHIANDGHLHRKTIRPEALYRWLIENNYPNSVQVLCFNCNMKKRMTRRY